MTRPNLFRFSAPAVCALAAAYSVERAIRGDNGSSTAQAACLIAAGLLVGIGFVRSQGKPTLNPGRREWAIGVLVVLAAVVLRLVLHRYLPLEDRCGFEELQMGSDGYLVLNTGVLPLEFRFSKVLAAVGLFLGGSTVEALRAPFRAYSLCSFPLLWICLRRLRVRRSVSAFIVLAAASSRWLVIAGGAAYEDFSAVTPLWLLLAATLSADDGERTNFGWAALAGFTSGVLLFENSSFRYAPLLAGGWLLARAIRRRSAPLFVFFLVPAALVALPMIVDLVQNGSNATFFEAVVRYGGERSQMLDPHGTQNLLSSIRVLAGLPVTISPFFAVVQGRAVPPVLGVLLLGGGVWALARWTRPFATAMAFAAVVAILGASYLTSSFATARLTAVLPILFILAGTLLQDLLSLFERLTMRRSDSGGWLRIAAPVSLVLVLVFLVNAGFERAEKLSSSPRVWNEYLNNEYVIARHISRVARPHAHVVVCDVSGPRDWTSDGISYWVFAKKQLTVESVVALPDPDRLDAGTTVVIGSEGGPLPEQRIQGLRDLARRTGSLRTLIETRGRGGRCLTASIQVGGV